MNLKFYKNFTAWINTVLASPIPKEVVAFHFNLYDGPYTHDIELIGAPTYDPDDSDWACDDIFSSPAPRFELPHEIVGAPWQSGLDATVEVLLNYMDSNELGAARLKESRAVSVGFVDGDLQLVWSAA